MNHKKTAGIAALALTGAMGFLSGCLDGSEGKPVAPVIVYASSISDTVGVAVSPDTVVSSGGPILSYSAISPLPAGLHVDSSTGKVSGTPTAASSAASYLVVATGPGGRDTITLGITVIAAPSAATSSSPSILSLTFNIPGVNALAKASTASTISLRELTVMLVSNTEDTIRDTFTSSTTPALSATATLSQTIQKNYSLKSLRTWKITATLRDWNDSAIGEDSANTQAITPGDAAHISLNLSPRFVMYAVELSIPDSINSTIGGILKQGLNLNRLVLNIDGVIRVDSTSSPSVYFSDYVAARLSYDYMTPGSHTVQVLAYGPMYAWNVANPLFSGTTTIVVHSGSDSAKSWTLQWVGPATDTDTMTATVGPTNNATILDDGVGEGIEEGGGVIP